MRDQRPSYELTIPKMRLALTKEKSFKDSCKGHSATTKCKKNLADLMNVC